MAFIEAGKIVKQPRLSQPNLSEFSTPLEPETTEIDIYRSKLRELRQQYYCTLYERYQKPRGELKIQRLNEYAANIAPLIQFEFADTARDASRTGINLPYGIVSWSRLAERIMFADSSEVVWDNADITPIIRADKIDNPDGNLASDIIFSPHSFERDFGDFVLTVKQWPLMRGEIDGVAYYKPHDPNLIYCLVAAPYYLEEYTDASSIINDLKDRGLLSEDMINRTLPAISLIAEHLLFQDPKGHPFEFRKFILGIQDIIGKEKGLAVASAIVEDIKEVNGPLLYAIDIDPYVYFWQRYLLETTEEQLEKELYLARTKIIPDDAILSVILSTDPSKAFDNTFVLSGAIQVLPTLFDKKVIQLIYPFLLESLENRKAEAGMILMLSDFMGHLPKDTVVRMAALMQILWTLIQNKDNIYDFHKIRDGKTTQAELLGSTVAAEMADLGMAEIINASALKNIPDYELGKSFREMVSNVVQGDLRCRSICWDNGKKEFNWDFDDKVYMEALDQIADIFYWFPYYFMEQRTKQKMGPGADFAANLVIFTRSFGQMILQVNDLEDFAGENKHDPYNDFARKISFPWKILMELKPKDVDSQLKDDLAKNQQRTKTVWNNLGEKRRNGKELTDIELAQLDEMKAIAHKYLPTIAQIMKVRLNRFYEGAKEALETLKTRNPRDESNLIMLEFFEQFTNGLWKKMGKYANP